MPTGGSPHLAAIRDELEALLGPDPDRSGFLDRFDAFAPDAYDALQAVYGERPEFEQHVAEAFRVAASGHADRSPELRRLDDRRRRDPDWYRDSSLVGGVCYADRFAGDLRGLRNRLDYLEELGITYLYLMPPFRTPPGRNDGGYAVSSYRETASGLGDIDDLRSLAADLRARGISLALDFVLNHTAWDHDWARAAIAGDPTYRPFYFIFEDRTVPDRYDATLREIFPEEHSGSFTLHDDQWVWTTFHDFQWDLNYSNPQVFTAMLGELLFIANAGAEIVRMDALAFIWKELGTSCEGLPQAHELVRAFRALTRIAAPAVIFKSEAIVHPDEVVTYLAEGECDIGYHPLLMICLWDALATGDTRLLAHSMRKRLHPPKGSVWVNYVRSHDDIGWGFADEDAADLGMDGFQHRQHLNRFFIDGRSFAVGRAFQYNPASLDMRISGTTASLAGLETALRDDDAAATDLAINRILLMMSTILALPGIPLLYLGDELGALNDYSYEGDPALSEDSRWVHRPVMDWALAEVRHDPAAVGGRIWSELHRMIDVRRRNDVFAAGAETEILDLDEGLFGFTRNARSQRMVVVSNFTPDHIPVQPGVLPEAGADAVSGVSIDGTRPFELGPYGFAWIATGLA